MYTVFVTLGLTYTPIYYKLYVKLKRHIVKLSICNFSDTSGNKAPKFQILTLCFPTTKNTCIEQFPRIRR